MDWETVKDTGYVQARLKRLDGIDESLLFTFYTREREKYFNWRPTRVEKKQMMMEWLDRSKEIIEDMVFKIEWIKDNGTKDPARSIEYKEELMIDVDILESLLNKIKSIKGLIW